MVKFPPYWCHLFIKLWFIGKRTLKRKMLQWGSLLIKTTCRTMSLIQIPRHTRATIAVLEWVGLGCLQLAVEQDYVFYMILYATNMQEVESHEGLFKGSRKLLRTSMYVQAGGLERSFIIPSLHARMEIFILYNCILEVCTSFLILWFSKLRVFL